MKIAARKSYLFALLFAILSFMVLASWGCRREEAPPPKSQAGPTLVIGLIPEQNIFGQKERYEPLAAYLAKRTGVNISLRVLSRYGNLINNFHDLGLDGAFFGSFTGALARVRLGVEFLARPEHADGTSTYHGLIFVRKDSGINNARDMKGKRFAFVDKATTAGWLLPMCYFKVNGIEDYRTWFKETYFTGTHEDAIYDVLERRADIGAAKNTVFSRLAASDPRITDELSILAKSPEVPANGLAVRKELDGKIKEDLRTALLRMDQDKEGRAVLQQFGAARFILTTPQDYQPVFEYAKLIGLDLATYDYIND